MTTHGVGMKPETYIDPALDTAETLVPPTSIQRLGDPMILGGTPIIFSVHALADTDERMFPISRHRSRRVFKKLIKRFGSEFRKQPVMYSMAGKIIAHPSFKEKLMEDILRGNW